MCYPFPKVGKVVQIWEKIYGKIFWKKTFLNNKPTPYGKTKKNIWKFFLEKAFYKKKGYHCRKVKNFG
jgi:hypothetical protein